MWGNEMAKQRLKKSLSEEERELMRDLGPDFYEYFSDSRLGKKDTTKTKGKRKIKPRFAIGDQVEVNGQGFGMVILGPYDGVYGANTYEIELESGEIIAQADDGKSISVYVAPVEENDDDEF